MAPILADTVSTIITPTKRKLRTGSNYHNTASGTKLPLWALILIVVVIALAIIAAVVLSIMNRRKSRAATEHNAAIQYAQGGVQGQDYRMGNNEIPQQPPMVKPSYA